MNELDYNSIKRKIEIQKCPEHKEHPKFIKNSKGFEIKACCENFRSQLITKSEKVIAEETEKALEKIMKGIFKR